LRETLLSHAPLDPEHIHAMPVTSANIDAATYDYARSHPRSRTEHFSAKQGVEDDQMTIICMGGGTVGPSVAWDLVEAFLSARVSQEKRHLRRLGKVLELENGDGRSRGALP
jgi:hypothetical protein